MTKSQGKRADLLNARLQNGVHERHVSDPLLPIKPKRDDEIPVRQFEQVGIGDERWYGWHVLRGDAWR